jgi:arylsulfatase
MWFLPNATQLAPAARASLGMKMEMYAGMVENMDYHIGRLVDYLKSVGEFENTLFIVFGDNGAEGADLFKMIAGTPGTLNYLNAAINWSQTHPKSWGDPGSFIGYGPMWAQVSMTPFSQYKGWMAEGGIRNALIVSGPNVKRSDGSINSEAVMHISDIMPTLLDIAQTVYPETQKGNKLPPLIGKSWTQMLANKTNTVRTDTDYMAWQLFGNRAVRQGDWKLRWQWKPYGKGEWELFNLNNDPVERKDLALIQPEKVVEMLKLWDDYVETNNVILPSRSIFEGLESNMPLRFPDDAGYPPLIYKRQFVPPTDMIKDNKK